MIDPKILIIPDIHGRDFYKEAVSEGIRFDIEIVCLGDYLDPYWWDGLIFYPVCLVVIGFAIRFVVCMCKVLTTKDFSWKYVFLGYK